MSEITIELVMARLEEGGKTLRLNVLGMIELTQLIKDHLKLVQNLELHHNQLKQLDLDSPTLESLGASNNEFQGMMKFGFPKLLRLDLSYNQITGVTFAYRSIQQLNLECNRLQKIDFLSNLKDLRFLNLGQNNLEKVDFIVFNTQLEELIIRKNKISTLKGALSNVPKLRILDASQNRIIETQFIDSLPELEELNLSRNLISQLKVENKNENLNILDLSYNQLDDLRVLEFKYPYLTHCYFQCNQIYATTSVDFLKLMSNLIDVQFQENPFHSTEYEDQFIVACPWLELINGREVGKPAQYVKQEVINLKQHLEELDISVNNFHLSDLEEGIVTEERLKAILRVQGFQDDEEQIEEKDENIMKEEEFQKFITESNEQMLNIRSNYFTRLKKYQGDNKDNSQQDEMKSSQIKEQEDQKEMRESQISLGRKLIIRSVPKPQKKPSVLQEISQLKQSMKMKEFQQSLGFRDQRMNLSSENFNIKKNSEQRSSSSNRQPGQVRLPKI